MKVFISSLITGFEAERDAAEAAITTLGQQAIRAEQFPAFAVTPQQACLAGVRDSDVVVLLLGGRYGATQPSGLSATHEEYREARERVPVLVFVQADADLEPAQRAFLDEVQAWATGHFRDSFGSLAELQRAVTRGLHEHELAMSAGAVDEHEMLERARNVLPQRRGSIGRAEFVVSLAAGPHQQVIRPAELEDPALIRDLQREALFGDHAILDSGEGTSVSVHGDALVFEQQSASLLVDQAGSIRITQPLADRDRTRTELPAIIEEDVTDRVTRNLRFSGWLLDRVDPVHRLTDIAVVCALVGADYMAWRAREEHSRSPNAGRMGSGGDSIATLTPPHRRRQALTHDADRIAEDLVVLLRRARA
jgi:hypothetical protein